LLVLTRCELTDLRSRQTNLVLDFINESKKWRHTATLSTRYVYSSAFFLPTDMTRLRDKLIVAFLDHN
jgi:hypothetical protein